MVYETENRRAATGIHLARFSQLFETENLKMQENRQLQQANFCAELRVNQRTLLNLTCMY